MILWAYGMFGANRAPILHRHRHSLQTDQNKIPHDPRHLGVLSGASKTIFEPMVHLAKLCTYLVLTLTLSLNRLKQDSTWPTSPKSFHRVRPKWFSNRYVRRIPSNYLASRLALSPNGPKQAFTWDSWPWTTIGCVQNDFRTYGMFGANRATILR
jgi:hypothetical protein